MDTSSRKIGNWLDYIEKSYLRLPRFQREYVWERKSNFVRGLLETIICKRKTPIGVLLVWEIDSDSPSATNSRNIEDAPDIKGECRELLIDGQQRLTALYKALTDIDDHRYYVEFDKYKPTKIVKKKKRVKKNYDFSKDPKKDFRKNLFPVLLLNPLEGQKIIDDWVKGFSPDDKKKTVNMIKNARSIFSKKDKQARIIPYFRLSKISKEEAIETYTTLNSNTKMLSDYHLAIAEMEAVGKKSLYDVERDLKKECKEISNLETDAIGELILKIFCLINGSMPSGAAYKRLPYEDLASNKDNIEQKIIDGVKWTVKKIENLKIWNESQLPTVVPLRVLPALYVACGGIKETTKNKKIINRYLWHAFLSDRYSKQANQRLKKDFDDLKTCITENKDEITIFTRSGQKGVKMEVVDRDNIVDIGWPQSNAKSTTARGVLLVCCLEGALTLKGDEILDEKNLSDRERHHIFPKSLFKKDLIKCEGNIVLNCMLIPKDENRKFRDYLPGDYIDGLFQDSDAPLPQVDVVRRLKTHCLDEDIAEALVTIKKDESIDLDDEFKKFKDKRAGVILDKIDDLLRLGEYSA